MDPVGISIAIAAIVAASLFAWHRNRVDGTFRSIKGNERAKGGDPQTTAPTPEWTALSGLLNEPLTKPVFVQFSGEYCAQCRRNQALFKRLNRSRSDFRFQEVSVEEHSTLVGELKIRRTPTIFLLDPTSDKVTRTEGSVALADLDQTLDDLIGRPA